MAEASNRLSKAPPARAQARRRRQNRAQRAPCEWFIAGFLKTVRAAGKPVGICGQAPSDYPEFARFLVHEGITSISVDAHALLRTRQIVAETEMGVTA